VPLSGSQEAISELNVRINQIEISCPTGVVTAYVSVTDQGGYSVTGLTRDDFLITETVGGYVGPPTSVPFVENTATLSAALVMDLSTSVTSVQDKVNDMQEAAAGFVDQLGADDEAEIVKFGPIIEVVQPYTSDKVLLNAAINTPWDKGAGTVLWDAAKIAVDDTAARTKDRKAVIVISDGFSYDTSIGLDDLIDYALLKNVPIFSVGLGNDINVLDLTTMADGTGGQYYEASTSDNLRTVYQQLADVLFSYQYILTYSSGLGAGVTDNITIKATLPLSTIEGIDSREITRPAICP
jgi:VWFA-related protein